MAGYQRAGSQSTNCSHQLFGLNMSRFLCSLPEKGFARRMNRWRDDCLQAGRTELKQYRSVDIDEFHGRGRQIHEVPAMARWLALPSVDSVCWWKQECSCRNCLHAIEVHVDKPAARFT